MSHETDLVLKAWPRLRRHPGDQSAVYIHKYYLVPEMKARIIPADLAAIHCLKDHELSALKSGQGVVILYPGMAAEKRLDTATLAAAQEACSAYDRDFFAQVTEPEVAAIVALNQRLDAVERSALADCDRVRAIVEQSPVFDDTEVELRISFYVRDDDPQGGEEAVDDFDVDGDVSLICTLRYCGLDLTDWGPDRFGLGDGGNHNTLGEHQPAILHDIRHTWLLHELYEQVGIPLKHLGRIGRVLSEYVVQHQRFAE